MSDEIPFKYISPGIRIIRVSVYDGVWNFTNLFLPYWRLIWHLKGDAVVYHGDGEIELSAGKQIIISPHTPLTCHSPGPIRQLFVYFTIDEMPGITRNGIYELMNHPGIDSMIHTVLSRTLNNNLGTNNSYQLIASLCQLALSDLPDTVFAGRRIVDSRIYRAISTLNSDYRSKIRIGDVADFSGMSVKSLERKFMETFGLSPMKYRQKLKVEKACSMLHFTDLNIDEIAEELGFSDRFHFTKTFIRQKAISPGKYRKGIDEFRH